MSRTAALDPALASPAVSGTTGGGGSPAGGWLDGVSRLFGGAVGVLETVAGSADKVAGAVRTIQNARDNGRAADAVNEGQPVQGGVKLPYVVGGLLVVGVVVYLLAKE